MVVSPALSIGTGDLFEPYEYVQPIGSRPNPLHLVRHKAPHEKPKLIVAERFVGAAAGVGQAAVFIAEARRISTLASPNVARVRELAVRGEDLIVFWDFVDGEKLAELWSTDALSLELALRLILDVLSGAGAIHALRDAKQQPMHLAHGEVSTASVVVGVDGIARILHAIARRLPGAQSEEASLGYLAPEVHAGAPYDARADVFSAGVLLWEALSGHRLFPETDSTAILARIRNAGIGPAAVPAKATWAQGLVGVAAKALAVSPEDRWASPAAMAGEIRKIAGLRLAPASAASTFAQNTIAERVNARRERLESASSGEPRTASVEKPAGPVGWSAPIALGSGVRRWGDAESSSTGASVAVNVPDAPEPPTPPRGEHTLESLPPSALNSVTPSAAEAAADVHAPPPPLPPRALGLATHAVSKDEASSASDLAASMDVPVSLAPPSSSTDALLTSVDEAEPFALEPRVNRRRTLTVLAGVAALGLIVFGLAGWRVAHRASANPSSEAFANSIPTATSEGSQSVEGAQLPQTTSAAPVVTAPVAATSPGVAITAPPHVPHVSAPAPHATPASSPKPISVNRGSRKPPAPNAPGHTKSTTNARFDPNSL